MSTTEDSPHLPYETEERELETELYGRLDDAEGAVDEAETNSPDSPNAGEIAGLMATLVGARLVSAGLSPQAGGTPDSEDEYRWFDDPVMQTYEKGRQDARSLLNSAGYNVSETPGMDNAAVHRQARNELLDVQRENLRRLVTDLEDEIESAVRSTIAEGGTLTEAREAARDRFEKVGRTRATRIAQTEASRAYNWALVSEYEDAGVESVEIREIEWQTAGDDRVCADCRSASGTYRIETAKKMLKNGVRAIAGSPSSDIPPFPHHVGCRCLLVPA